MNHLAKFTSLLAAALLLFVPSCTVWRHGGGITTIQSYEDALRSSTDPVDKAVLLQIDNGPAELAREKAAAAAESIPVTDVSVPLPDRDNAAPLYLAWQTQKRGKLVLPIYAGPLSIRHSYTPEQIHRIESIFADNNALVALRNQAIAKPQVYIEFNPNNPSRDMQVYNPIREAAREIVTQSFLLANSKKYAEAVELQTKDLQIVRQLNTRPQVICALVSYAAEDIALTGYRQLAAMAGPNAEVDSEIEHVVETNLPAETLKSALINDLPAELYALDTFRHQKPDEFSLLLSFTTTDDSSTVNDGDLPEHRFSAAEQKFICHVVDGAEALLIAHTRTLAAAAEEPPMARRQVFGHAEQPYSRSARLHDADYFPRLANIMLSLGEPLELKDDARRADEQVTLATMTLLKQKAQDGRFPDALPNSFPDPFSGKQLGYKREGDNGFVVYTAGPSGQFDGGHPGDKLNRDATYFRYPPPPPIPVPRDEQ